MLDQTARTRRYIEVFLGKHCDLRGSAINLTLIRKVKTEIPEVGMRLLRFLACDLSIALAFAFLLLVFNASAAAAKEPPSDICSLLASQQLQKTLGQPFGATKKTTAPAAYSGQPSGTNCHYTDQQGGTHEVILIVYVDRSPAEAKQTFEKLSAFFEVKSKPSGVGDTAYLDASHAIHVLKGNIRYFINVASDASDATRERQAQDLATSVAAQI